VLASAAPKGGGEGRERGAGDAETAEEERPHLARPPPLLLGDLHATTHAGDYYCCRHSFSTGFRKRRHYIIPIAVAKLLLLIVQLRVG
jgi:hypothetical protein